MRPPGPEVEVGSAANSYEILAKLATGGMAEIFLARGVGSVGVSRHVVLKRILGEHATDQNFVTMFLDEARLVAQLQHPNIAQVHDVGTLGDSYFFTMEYVHGETVRALLQQSKASGREVPLAAVLAIIAGAAAGLQHAHERLAVDGTPLGIVHRDVTPSNLMVSFEGNVKVVDFGVAMSAGNGDRESQAGTIKGKTTYLSPEQCNGLALDRRSDLFSLGIVMWEMLACDRLFRRTNEHDAMSAIVNLDAPAPSTVRPSCPKDVDAIVLKLLARDRDQRFASAAELIDAIEDAAVANHAKLSASTLARLLRETFGTRPEPWIELDRRARANPVKVTVKAGEPRATQRLAAVPGLELLPERRSPARLAEEAERDLAIPLAPKAPIVAEVKADSDGGVVAPADDAPTMRWNVIAHPPRPQPSIFDTLPQPPTPPIDQSRATGSQPPLSNKALEELFASLPAEAPAMSAPVASRLVAGSVKPRGDLAIPRTMTPRPFPAMKGPTSSAMPTVPRALTGSSQMPAIPRSATGSGAMSPASVAPVLARAPTPPPEDEAPTVYEPLSSAIVDEAQRAELAELAELAKMSWPVVDRATARGLIGDQDDSAVVTPSRRPATIGFDARNPAVAPWLSGRRQKNLIVAALAAAAVLVAIAVIVGVTGSKTAPRTEQVRVPVVAPAPAVVAVAVPEPEPVDDVVPPLAAVAVTPPPKVAPPAAITKHRIAAPVKVPNATLTAAYAAGKYANVVSSCAAGSVAIDPSICVLAACRVGNQARAKQWYASTPSKRRGSLLTTCLSLGVPLDGSTRTRPRD